MRWHRYGATATATNTPYRDLTMIQVKPGLFLRYEPRAEEIPLLVDVSRSGREYPTDFRSQVPFSAVHDNVSMHVDDLWGDAPAVGGTLLFALFPNTYIDVNRDELDIDADLIDGEWPVPLNPTASKRGLGLLKAKSRYGEPLQERKLTVAEVVERLDGYHRSYHAEMRRILDGFKDRFGKAYQLSCHCMSAIGAPTHVDPGQERADFCLGYQGNVDGGSATETASKDYVEFLAATIRSLGYTCTINFPYAGGELIGRYGNPSQGVESVLVEINKKLFMDTKTFRKTDGFGPLKANLGKVLQAVAGKIRGR